MLLWGLVPLLALCAVLAGWYFQVWDREGARQLAGKPSIAVMPFRNPSADPAQEYFAEGINEDLITDLAKFPGLYVASRSASFAYKGKLAPITSRVRMTVFQKTIRYGDRNRNMLFPIAAEVYAGSLLTGIRWT